MAANLEFYFFYGSIHSYLSVMRIGACSERTFWGDDRLEEANEFALTG